MDVIPHVRKVVLVDEVALHPVVDELRPLARVHEWQYVLVQRFVQIILFHELLSSVNAILHVIIVLI